MSPRSLLLGMDEWDDDSLLPWDDDLGQMLERDDD
jgi:hypothetical protein